MVGGLAEMLEGDDRSEFALRLRLLRRTALPFQECADNGGEMVRGPRHCHQVESRIEEMLPAETARRFLTLLEAYVLLAAIIVHDFGYSRTVEQHWVESCNILDGLPRGLAEHQPGQNLWSNTLGQLEEARPAVKAVVMLHGPDVDPSSAEYRDMSCGVWGTIRIRVLGGLLRLADDLETGLWRVREIPPAPEAQEVRVPSGRAEVRLAIKEIRCLPQERTVIIRAEPASPETEEKVWNEFRHIHSRYGAVRPYAPDWARYDTFVLQMLSSGGLVEHLLGFRGE